MKVAVLVTVTRQCEEATLPWTPDGVWAANALDMRDKLWRICKKVGKPDTVIVEWGP